MAFWAMLVKNPASQGNSATKGGLPKGIRIIKSPITGKITYEACAASINRKKVRKEFGEDRFDGRANALSAAKHWLEDMRKEVRDNKATVAKIPPHDQWVYLVHIEKITQAGMSFQQCLEAGLKYHREHFVKRSVTVERAVEEFLAFKRRENCKESYFKSMGALLLSFGRSFTERKMSEIRPEDIEQFLAKREMGPVSWNNWRRDLRTLFNFGLDPRNSWVKTNPAESVALKKIDNEEVRVFSIEEAKKVLIGASASFPRLVPFLVVGMFGGLRREEAQNLQWEDLDWEEKTLRVRNAKNRSVHNRYVHMEPVLFSWLTKYRQASGPICTMKYARRNDLQELSEKIGLDCTENLYRHSFGSYHLAAFQDKAKTMLEMGHSNTTTFDRYYRKPEPKWKGLLYWDLTPEAVLPSLESSEPSVAQMIRFP